MRAPCISDGDNPKTQYGARNRKTKTCWSRYACEMAVLHMTEAVKLARNPACSCWIMCNPGPKSSSRGMTGRWRCCDRLSQAGANCRKSRRPCQKGRRRHLMQISWPKFKSSSTGTQPRCCPTRNEKVAMFEGLFRPQHLIVIAALLCLFLGSVWVVARVIKFAWESDTRTCPFCAERIQAEAIKCKHCGEFLNKRPA